MTVRLGDVVMAWFPFASGRGGKRRPGLVVQNDVDNQKLTNTVIAQITSNLGRVGDKSHLLIELATPDGQQTGLLHDSVVSCNNLATIEQSLIDRKIGELDAALADKSPEWYENVVNRLLDSPHYGERWGRHWLDAARYADSDGFEKDKSRQVWFYRDWVIGALNRDLPYDRERR